VCPLREDTADTAVAHGQKYAGTVGRRASALGWVLLVRLIVR